MATRLDLHSKLVEALGSDNVYYNPPETLKLVYPCIVYTVKEIDTIYANNLPYLNTKQYEVVVISKKPDDPAVYKILRFPLTRHSSRYVVDGLYHDAFIIKHKEE